MSGSLLSSECLQYLRDSEDKEYLRGIGEDMQKIIFQDKSFLKYVLNLLKNGVSISRLSALLEQTDLVELISSYQQADVKAVLDDKIIPAEYLRIYMQYFYRKGYGDEDKKMLVAGM